MSSIYAVSTRPASSPSPPSQPMRLACDRCHGQKLRCPRDPQGGSCSRCAKVGAQCQVSLARRTGRPAKNSKLQHHKSNNLSTHISESSLADHASSIEKASASPNAKRIPTTANHVGPIMGADDYFPSMTRQAPQCTKDMSETNGAPDALFEYMDMLDTTYGNPLDFGYEEVNCYLHTDMSLPYVMGPTCLDYSSTFLYPMNQFDMMIPPLTTHGVHSPMIRRTAAF